MAFSIDYLYNKFLDKIDKQGTNTVSLPRTMEMLVTQTYSFLESIINFNEINQKQRDLVAPLSRPLDLLMAVNPANGEELIAALPQEYYHIETVIPQIPGKTVREISFIRKGELQGQKINSLRTPTDEYPTIIQYSDYVALYGSSVSQGVKMKGWYWKKPEFGNYGGDISVEIAVDLPDHTVEKILEMMVSSYYNELGDPRHQGKSLQEVKFGKSN
jgi:hypothetical protein